MKKIIISTIVIGLLLTTSIASVNAFDMEEETRELETSGPYFHAKPIADVYVDDDAPPEWYDETHVKTITEGINNASEGDTIFVFNGAYYENVKVDKSITLKGEDRDTTIIDACGSGDVVQISSDIVSISGFTIQNSGDYWGGEWSADGCDAGIDISSNYNTIYSNTITNNHDGIYLCSSSNNKILDNNISDNYVGIETRGGSNNIVSGNNIISSADFGIHLESSGHNNISDNNISDNYAGIEIWYSSNNNCISENSIYDNNILNGVGFGIEIRNSKNNIISDNNISNNYFGINLWCSSLNNTLSENIISSSNYGMWLKGSSNNIMFHNNFINNTYNARDEGNNQWDDGYPSGGNYWEDYKTKYPKAKPRLLMPWIWDTPYDIDGGDNKDLYPLVEQYSSSQNSQTSTLVVSNPQSASASDQTQSQSSHCCRNTYK